MNSLDKTPAHQVSLRLALTVDFIPTTDQLDWMAERLQAQFPDLTVCVELRDGTLLRRGGAGMTTQTTPEATTACPSWCTLKPGPQPDLEDLNGYWMRGHQGPKFGPYVSCGSCESSYEPGEQIFEINVDDLLISDSINSGDAIDVARELLAAAQWFNDRQRSISLDQTSHREAQA